MSLQVNKQELKIALMIIPFFTFAVGFKWPFDRNVGDNWKIFGFILFNFHCAL